MADAGALCPRAEDHGGHPQSGHDDHPDSSSQDCQKVGHHGPSCGCPHGDHLCHVAENGGHHVPGNGDRHGHEQPEVGKRVLRVREVALVEDEIE